MVWWIASFELRKRLLMLSTYVYFIAFFACGALMVFIQGGAFAGLSAGAGTEKIHANAPFVVSQTINSLSNLGLLVSAAVFGQAVHQDFEAGASHLFFTMPVRRQSYLGGRFLGALIFSLVIFAGAGLGALLASVSPVIVDRSLFGPFRLAPFLWPYVTFVIPNVILTGGIFFALGTLGRKMMPVYAGAVIMALGYLVAQALLHDLDSKTLAGLLDPFGTTAASLVVRYWTPSEKNTKLLSLTGLLLANRAIWLSVGLGAVGLTYARFRFTTDRGRDRTLTARTAAEAAEAPADDSTGPLPAATPHRSPGALLALLARATRLELVETVKSVYFGIFVLAGGLFTLVLLHFSTKLYGSPVWPTTRDIAETGSGGFALFVLIIITVYAGEVVWRERDLRFHQIIDALPVPTWVPCLAKLLSLCLTPALVLAAVLVFGVTYQTFNGYHHHELGLYLELLYGVTLPGYVFLCVLAFTLQSLVQHKYIGHFAMVAFYLFQAFETKLGLEHGLMEYGHVPHPTYSDMNGFGHFLKPMLFYDGYWTGYCVLFAVLSVLLWARGTDAKARTRLRIARERFTAGPRAFAALGFLVVMGTGGAIYYESDVLNHFQTYREQETARADYEKTYKSTQSSAQPRITDVKVDFDIYPETETLEARGTYQIGNHSNEPIHTVHVELPPEQPFRKLTVGDALQPAESNAALGVYTFELPQPLAPGETTTLAFDLRFHDRGFRNDGNRTDLCENGTFFTNSHLPHIGYERNKELSLDNDRKKYGLPPRDRLADLRDSHGLESNLISGDADWVTFESTVSTSPDQTAVVPGYLVKEWTANGRRFFRYEMDSKMLDFFSVLSARYAVKRGVWKNPAVAAGAPSSEVNLEIYYHPGHEWDLDEMMRGLEDTLTYDTAAFGPYQHRQARILEFPRYQMLAQSFPNTIPWSEGTGFINRVDPKKEGDVDVPYYGAAHELSHQWWAHQVIGGRVQGVTLLDETLAEYSAFMVLKRRFGAQNMRRFLKYEMDQYLLGRALEQKREVPLERVEDQAYIRYSKGAVVMYALADYIGEDAVNQALRAFLERYRFQGPPYPNAVALIDELRKVTPREMQYAIHDLFEVITLYDDRALSAKATKIPDGRFEVTMKLSAKKMQAGEQGEETEVPMDDLVDVGAVDEKNVPIALERRRVKSGESEVTIVVDRLPAKAGIDPIDKLIDRHPDDNLVSVEGP